MPRSSFFSFRTPNVNSICQPSFQTRKMKRAGSPAGKSPSKTRTKTSQSPAKEAKTEKDGVANWKEKMVLDLFELGCVQFGSFVLKSGITSPIYVDLRLIVSSPSLIQTVVRVISDLVKGVKFDVICGVPYTGIPVATALSLHSNVKMVLKRKESKGYGTKKMVEGCFSAGEKCLIVEDIVTSGLSVLETVSVLEDVSLKVTDIVALVDREQGAAKNLSDRKLRLHSAFTISEVLNILHQNGKIDDAKLEEVTSFIRNTKPQITTPAAASNASKVTEEAISQEPDWTKEKALSFGERSELCSNAVAKKILQLMERKKTNLCVSADVYSKKELLSLVERVGPHICLLKMHIDTLKDYDETVVPALLQLAKKFDFLIFEDRKFADIGNTVLAQFTSGIYNIAEWADIVNAHILPGPGIVQGLVQGIKNTTSRHHECALLLLAEMSSQGNLLTKEYTEKCVELAKSYKSNVIGFISMKKLCRDPEFIYFTPGVQLQVGKDAMGQQYNTPDAVIGKQHSDVIIVGRGIYGAQDPTKAALTYKQAGWEAYQRRLKH